MKKNYNKKFPASEIHELCMIESRNFIQAIMTANKYLVKKNQKNIARQLRELKEVGIFINRSTIVRMSNGRYRTVYLNTLFYFAWYWNMSIIQLWEIGNKIRNGIEI